MGLTKRQQSNTVFLEAKFFCLWQEIKQPEEGSVTITTQNPRTKQEVKKHGYSFDNLTGRAVKLEKYDRKVDNTRYFGFKLHVMDGPDKFILTMPYQSQFLRRFLHVAPAINWTLPLSITVFKGKDKRTGKESLGVWFQQQGETIRPYFTKENPRGMPQAQQDPVTQEWDFRAQHQWLVKRLMDDTMPAIDQAAARFAPEDQPLHSDAAEPEYDEAGAHGTYEPHAPISDDDVPF